MLLFVNMTNKIHDYDYALKRNFYHKILVVALFILVIYIFLTLILRFFLFPAIVHSDSMSPAIGESDFIFITPLASKHDEEHSTISIERGDIIYVSESVAQKTTIVKRIIDSVVGFVTFQKIFPFNTKDNSHSYLRRVVGLPGDTVYVQDYVAYIKNNSSGHFLTEFEMTTKSYDLVTTIANIKNDKNIGTPGIYKEYTLANNEYFLLCDNRIEGIDSRIWGPVKNDMIKGTAIIRFLPTNKFGKL